jgi:hypothetical protein
LIVGYAQANSWSLEELHLDVTIAEESDQPSFDDCSFGVEGLKLTGAVCRYPPYTTFIGRFLLDLFPALVWLVSTNCFRLLKGIVSRDE